MRAFSTEVPFLEGGENTGIQMSPDAAPGSRPTPHHSCPLELGRRSPKQLSGGAKRRLNTFESGQTQAEQSMENYGQMVPPGGQNSSLSTSREESACLQLWATATQMATRDPALKCLLVLSHLAPRLPAHLL